MGHVNMSDDKSCKNCFYGEISFGKLTPKEGEKPNWCWRFNFETDYNGYCNDKYYMSIEESKNKFGKLSRKIAGYLERKKDFDKAELYKLLLGFILGIIVTVIGVYSSSKL